MPIENKQDNQLIDELLGDGKKKKTGYVKGEINKFKRDISDVADYIREGVSNDLTTLRQGSRDASKAVVSGVNTAIPIVQDLLTPNEFSQYGAGSNRGLPRPDNTPEEIYQEEPFTEPQVQVPQNQGVDPISQLLNQKYQDLPEAPEVQREDQSLLGAVAQLLYGLRQSRANPPEALPELERQLAQAEARRDKDYEVNSRNANLKNQRDIQQVYLENKDLQSRRDSILKLLSQGKGKPLGVKEGSQAIESLMFAIQSERDPVRKEDLILLLDNTIQELKPNG